MARGQVKSNVMGKQRQPPSPKDQRKWPRGIEKHRPLRKSLRLQAIRQSQEQSLSRSNHPKEVQAPSSPPTSDQFVDLIETTQRPQTLHKASTLSRKRKRGQEEPGVGHPSSQTQEQPPFGPLGNSPSNCDKQKKSPRSICEGSNDPLEHWIKTGKWRKEDFKQDSQVREDFERGKSAEEPGRKDWLQGYFDKETSREMAPHPQNVFARPPLTRKESQSLKTTNDQPPQRGKSSQYNNAEYEDRLQEKGSYMDVSPRGITDTSRELCRTLLEKEQTIPQDTLFRDDLFKDTCGCVQGRNEAMVVRDITPLICPSAQGLRTQGAKYLNLLYESVNEAWSNMNTFEGTLPQPDYSVGFKRSAFTKNQLERLKPFVGPVASNWITYFMATSRMYFPFFTCEVKCGASALDFADRQNAQSMSVALRALVVLFKYVKREKELDQKILAFSISHDHRYVRIYGHYPVIEGDEFTFYRHPIHSSDFTILDGKEKWTAYKFTKSVYDHFMPKLHKLICSAIDDLPADINFSLSQSASFSQSKPPSSQPSNVEMGEDESHSNIPALQEVTPTTSYTQATEPASKKPKNQ